MPKTITTVTAAILIRPSEGLSRVTLLSLSGSLTCSKLVPQLSIEIPHTVSNSGSS